MITLTNHQCYQCVLDWGCEYSNYLGFLKRNSTTGAVSMSFVYLETPFAIVSFNIDLA